MQLTQEPMLKFFFFNLVEMDKRHSTRLQLWKTFRCIHK